MPFTKLLYQNLHSLELQTVAIVVGAVLVLSHVIALLRHQQVEPWLRKLPRNQPFGIALMTLNFFWVFVIWTEMDLGEFYRFERAVQIVILAGYLAVVFLVTEFIAVRAIGMFLILLAAPLLDAAFLKMPDTRLLLVLLAYVGAVVGMFFVGMPYLLRDAINWVASTANRWRAAAVAGAVYGAVLLVCALLYFKGV
jgi:hypothetical protein